MTKEFKRPQQTVPPLRSQNTGWAKGPLEKAELFAKHLSQVFVPNTSVMKDFEDQIDAFINSDQQLSLPIKPVTPRELSFFIKQLGKKKAPGYDLITGEIMHHLPRKPIVLLTMIINAILRVHYYPKLWKISQICMIPKPGKPPTETSSYRPISLLPTISKLFEKIFLSRLKPVLDEENIIPNHQFGFRQNHSTVEQVHRVVNKIRQSLEKKEYCAAVFLDVQQAFDRVWHKGLLYKLKTKLPNSYYMVLKSYLLDRKFQVKFSDEVSQLYDIKASVPQGSVLGPILYSIYTADLPDGGDVVTATYADDTACLASDKEASLAVEKLQNHLVNIDQWLDTWRIKPNVTKSVQITFTLRRGECPPVTMRGEQLPKKTSVRYLGLHLDKRLTWANHIKAKRKEADIQFKNLYWLVGRQSSLSLSNKILIYKAIIKPIWTYGIQLWGSASNSNLEILQRFQNKALRTICNAPWFTRNIEIHEYLNIPTVKEEVNKYSKNYKNRLENHTNELARDLLITEGDITRLKRWQILHLDQRV
uniref:Reverse transcriptase domain-containing protein n=1 Tax=Heliothis virescens TaxID=7102 RepID=A0A2A4K8E7_HELVI